MFSLKEKLYDDPLGNNKNQEKEADFIAIGDDFFREIIWEKKNNTSVFEIKHPNLSDFVISLNEISGNKIYNILINGVEKQLTNYRTIHFPTNLNIGPAIIALSLRDSHGYAVEPAVLLEYNYEGILVDCIVPEDEIHFIDNDLLAPCYIIRNGNIITLPIDSLTYFDIYDVIKNSQIINAE